MCTAVGDVEQSRNVNKPERQRCRKPAFHSACKSDRHGKGEKCHDGDDDGEIKPHLGALLRRPLLDSDEQDQTAENHERGKNEVINNRSEDNYCIAAPRAPTEQRL